MKNIPLDSRPREKLLTRGAAALSDTELLALLLRTGLKGKGVLQLAQELLDSFGGMQGLLHASAEDLKRIKGLGPAKRAELVAVLELARRALAAELREQPAMQSISAVRDYLQLQLGARPYEVFAVMFLDTHQRLIALEELFRGTLTHTSVYPREVALRALHLHADAVVLAHNHPSSDVRPSEADKWITQKIKSALGLLDIRVVEHMIVGRNASFSFSEAGLL
jgi:DNA repair protein RadC